MAVEGPLALRVNIWDPANKVFHSPSRRDFIWPTNGIAIAECPWCPVDDQGFVVTSDTCTCGIYSGLERSVVNSYAYNEHAAWFLVEGLGTGWLHQSDVSFRGEKMRAGMTSPAVQLIAIVNTGKDSDDKRKLKRGTNFVFSGQNQALAMANRIYRIPIINLNDARAMAKIMWEKYGMRWEDHYL